MKLIEKIQYVTNMLDKVRELERYGYKTKKYTDLLDDRNLYEKQKEEYKNKFKKEENKSIEKDAIIKSLEESLKDYQDKIISIKCSSGSYKAKYNNINNRLRYLLRSNLICKFDELNKNGEYIKKIEDLDIVFENQEKTINELTYLRKIDVTNLNECHKTIRKMKQQLDDIKANDIIIKNQFQDRLEEINKLNKQIENISNENKSKFKQIAKKSSIEEMKNYKNTGKRNLKKKVSKYE